MPPKSKVLKSITKCIKFGEILIDENKKVVLLCVNCFQDFGTLQEFCKHLKNCTAKHIFQTANNGLKLECDTGKLLTKVQQTMRELHIFGVQPKAAESSISDIEAEILDPRWYTDSTAISPIRKVNKNTATYNDLIEEVTPFVQFKENVRLLSTPKQEFAIKQQKTQQRQAEINATRTVAPPATEADVPKHVVMKVAATQNPVSSQTNKPPMQRNAIATTTKPNCARSLTTATAANTAGSPLKRKAVAAETIINPPAATAKNQLAAHLAAKRARTTAVTTTVSPQKPILKGNAPRVCLNPASIGAQTQPQTLKMQPQAVVNQQRTAITQKPAINAIPTQQTRINLKPQPIHQVLPKLIINSNATTTATTIAAPPPTAPAAAANNKQTVDILNKLQTLGLKIQRTNPAPTQPKNVLNEKDKAALEIIKKLQSKGMEIKRLPKTSPTSAPIIQIKKAETAPKSTNVAYINPKTTTVMVPKHFLVRKCN